MGATTRPSAVYWVHLGSPPSSPSPGQLRHLVKHPITSRGTITLENFVLTSISPYSPTGFAISNLQQGSNKGGAGDIWYHCSKLSFYEVGECSGGHQEVGEQGQTYHPHVSSRRERLLYNPGLKCIYIFRDELSRCDTCEESLSCSSSVDGDRGFWGSPPSV